MVTINNTMNICIRIFIAHRQFESIHFMVTNIHVLKCSRNIPVHLPPCNMNLCIFISFYFAFVSFFLFLILFTLIGCHHSIATKRRTGYRKTKRNLVGSFLQKATWSHKIQFIYTALYVFNRQTDASTILMLKNNEMKSGKEKGAYRGKNRV